MEEQVKEEQVKEEQAKMEEQVKEEQVKEEQVKEEQVKEEQAKIEEQVKKEIDLNTSSKEPYDAIIIGSGVGGLSAGAVLSKFFKKKKVLILEKHWTLGGQTHEFKRKGKYSWDVGIHYVGEISQLGLIGRAFYYITEGRLKWHKMPYSFDNYIYPDFKFNAPSDEGQYKKDLIKLFPKEKSAIIKHFRTIRLTRFYLTSLITERHMPLMLKLPFTIFNTLGFLFGLRKQCYSTVKEYLDMRFKDERLKAVLVSLWPDYGVPPDKAMLGAHSMIFFHYYKGGYYPSGGGSAIANSIIPTIEKHGGKCLTNHEVKEIIVKNGKAIGVRVENVRSKDERVIYAKKIISNVGAYNTFRTLLKEPIHPEIEEFVTGHSFLTLYVGFKESPASLGIKGENYWFHPSFDHVKNSNNNLFNADDEIGAFLSFPSLKDSSSKSHTAEIMAVCNINYDQYKKWHATNWKKRGDEYIAFKEKVAEKLLNLVEKNIPGFKALVDYKEVSTPLSNEYFLNRAKGMCYGIPVTPKRYKAKYLNRVYTKIKNLYISGSDVFSVGVAPSMLGGIFAGSFAGSFNKWFSRLALFLLIQTTYFTSTNKKIKNNIIEK